VATLREIRTTYTLMDVMNANDAIDWKYAREREAQQEAQNAWKAEAKARRRR
jgi:hypothetical protein